MRFGLKLSCATSLISVALLGCAPSAPPPKAIGKSASVQISKKISQPNVIVIIADDLGYADISTYFRGRITTPNIDRLGREGVVFTQGYVSAPICSPSRAGLMTGRHQQRFGFEYNNGPARRDFEQRLGLDPDEITLADQLRTAGYHTGAIGKWHLGARDEFYPTNRGFDEFWGFLTGQTNFIRPDATDAVNALPPGAKNGGLVPPSKTVSSLNAVIEGPNRDRVNLGDGYLTEQITDEALSYIDRNKDRPFFLYVAHPAPHTPLQVTKKYYDRFPQIKNKAARIYAGMVSALDDSVGAILDGLEQKGLAENTIVVFLSDNGCAAYVPGICSPEPLSGGKLTYLEGGIRVPFMMKWPAKIPAGTVHSEPISSLDIFPTATSAAGISLPNSRTYDGFDLMPQIAKGQNSVRSPMFWRTLPMNVIRDGDWKYYKDLDSIEFLYNLKSDPKEVDNRAAFEPKRLTEMRAKFESWEKGMVAPKWPGRKNSYEFGGRSFKFTP
jgi:arylsulfatase A-like enzyme